jgi:polar amino acid transport system substrate-binding protein/glutamate/aspartate transport system substrate-binding protein
MRRLFTLAAVFAVLSQAAAAATLDRIRDAGAIRLGYRVDAKPYSYQDANGQPAGYIVDLCTVVSAALGPHFRPQ